MSAAGVGGSLAAGEGCSVTVAIGVCIESTVTVIGVCWVAADGSAGVMAAMAGTGTAMTVAVVVVEMVGAGIGVTCCVAVADVVVSVSMVAAAFDVGVPCSG